MQGLVSLNQFQKFVSSLGGLGRYGDTYMIHAEEGETVVPMEVLDRNPVLKKRLFKSMKALGIDPGRYIVGNNLNSLNPVTGQPEFFFKRIKKALGDIAGYAAPIVGAMYGPAAGALVGAGLGAFKRENPGDPSQWAQMGMLGGGSGIAANILGGTPDKRNWLTGKGLSGRFGTDDPVAIGKRMLGMDKTYKGPKTEGYYDKWFGDTTKIPGAEEELIDSQIDIVNNQLRAIPEWDQEAKLLKLGEKTKLISKKEAIKKAGIGPAGMTWKEMLGLYSAGTIGLGALIDYTSKDDEDVGEKVDPYKRHHKVFENILSPHLQYAKGGVMDLQGGGFSQGPGTGTSDSIPAMLSDGEFVMTADAVRGAGGGDRREGARKMYEAMDRLEARA